jgi:predicted HTH domain antitoxin
MTITIPDEAVSDLDLSPERVRLELAVALFADNKATLARAARIAGLPYLKFQLELGQRQIPMHYGIEDWEADLRTLREMDDR